MNKPGQFELLDFLEANWLAHRFFIFIGPESVTDFPLYWGGGGAANSCRKGYGKYGKYGKTRSISKTLAQGVWEVWEGRRASKHLPERVWEVWEVWENPKHHQKHSPKGSGRYGKYGKSRDTAPAESSKDFQK